MPHLEAAYQNEFHMFLQLLDCPKIAKEMISTKVQMMSPSGKFSTLTMNEVSLKANLRFDQCKDEVVGVEDSGEGKRTNKVTNFFC